MRTAVVLIACTVTAAAAHADPPSLTPVVSEPIASAGTESYALQTLSTDGAALALIAAGHSSGPVIALGVATYAVGAPLVHGYHHQSGHAAGSLALRLGLPLLGALVGAAAASHDSPDSDGQVAAPAFGVMCGAIAASLVDAAFLARQPVRAKEPRWAPAVGTTRQGGLTAGIAGHF